MDLDEDAQLTPPAADQTMSLRDWFHQWWERLAPLYPVNHPDFWTKCLEFARESLEDQNSTILDNFEPLETGVKKILKYWKSNWKRWSADTFGELYAKTSRLLGGTYQMSLSCLMVTTIEDYVDGCLSADPPTPEDFSSGVTKEIISTSSTAVHGVMDRVDAGGERKRVFSEVFENLCGGPDSSMSLTGSTGRMYSYISSCRNGKADRKFGLEEGYSDLRVTVKIYDGEESAASGDQFWLGKMKELDITIPQRHPIANKLETVFLDATKLLQKKGVSLKESPKRFRPY